MEDFSSNTLTSLFSSQSKHEMDNLRPTPSCSKDLTNYDVSNNNKDNIDPCDLKYEEKEFNMMPLPKLPLRCESMINNYSGYDIYDVNNNCMLTNLNNFGLTFFNINDNDETAEELFNNDVHLDSAVNVIDQIFEDFTENVDYISKNEAKLNEVNIFNLDETKKQNMTNIDEHIIYNMDWSHKNVPNVNNIKGEQLHNCIRSQKYCAESLQWFQLNYNDVEETLECNRVAEVCVTDTVTEIANDCDKNINNNKLPNTVFELLNDKVGDKTNLINVKSNDCLLVGNRDIKITDNSDKQSDDSSDTGSYHSSDFEFIDENEARMECKLNIEPTDIVANITGDDTKEFYDNDKINDYFSKPEMVKNASIPSGHDYHNLFLKQNVPYTCINMEHKTISSIKGMEVTPGPTSLQFKCHLEDANSQKEAEDSIQIILSMYPNENKKGCSQ